MQEKFTIEWFLDTDGENLKEEEMLAMREEAREDIFNFIEVNGYNEGELIVSLEKEDEEEKTFYGWWKKTMIL